MKTKMAVLFGALVLGAVSVGSASADRVWQPGIPGTPNCEGQTTAYLAQAGKNLGVQDARGIGQLAAYVNLTVADIRAIVAAYCAGP
jgi:hypothetical protein